MPAELSRSGPCARSSSSRSTPIPSGLWARSRRSARRATVWRRSTARCRGRARRRRRALKAVDGVSFAIRRGETFSLVGESGCGKSTVARVVVGLYQPTRGSVEFDGVNIADPASREDKIRRRMQMIFQDPFASLNPRWRVRDIIAEPIRAHRLAGSRAEIRARVDELLAHAKLAP